MYCHSLREAIMQAGMFLTMHCHLNIVDIVNPLNFATRGILNLFLKQHLVQAKKGNPHFQSHHWGAYQKHGWFVFVGYNSVYKCVPDGGECLAFVNRNRLDC